MITAQLVAVGAEATKVTVTTDLTITGKVAQFGRGALVDVSDKLLKQFVHNLETTVLSEDAAHHRRPRRAAPSPTRARPRPSTAAGEPAPASPRGAAASTEPPSRRRGDRSGRSAVRRRRPPARSPDRPTGAGAGASGTHGAQDREQARRADRSARDGRRTDAQAAGAAPRASLLLLLFLLRRRRR